MKAERIPVAAGSSTATNRQGPDARGQTPEAEGAGGRRVEDRDKFPARLFPGVRRLAPFPRRGKLFWLVTVAAAAILIVQLFVPPIIGLSDQNDFRRVIGVFGYGPEPSDPPATFAWVAPKYIPDPAFRARGMEHFTSEYLFAVAALAVNKVISRDGKLDIEVMGLVHALAFVAAFMRLLFVTRNLRARTLIWIAALVILTDVGYVAYWNSFYTEPASCIFCLFLLAESIEMCDIGRVSAASLIRWTLWAVLFTEAKEQNATSGLLLALFSALLWTWAPDRRARCTAAVCAAVLAAVSSLSLATVPRDSNTARIYEMVFLAIVPESRNAATDLATLGLDPQLRDYSGTGPWSAKTAYPALVESGALGRIITPMKIVEFYLLRPTRLWRHIQSLLPVATRLRPDGFGNFEFSAGLPPETRSRTFAAWSAFHEHVLPHFTKFMLFALLIPAPFALWNRIRKRARSLWIDFAGLLAASCLLAFLTAIFGDAWENVRHLFLFNLLLDTTLVAAGAWCWSFAKSKNGLMAKQGYTS